jgi:hypothetical protein
MHLLITLLYFDHDHDARGFAFRATRVPMVAKYRKTFSIFVAIRSSTIASAQAIYFF